MMKNGKQRLLVEGNDDKHVVFSLCQKYNIPKNFEIQDCHGVEALEEQIGEQLKVSDMITLGIMIDADIELQSRWISLRKKLLSLNFNVPDDLPETGLITKGERQTIGVWIMPNNNTNGMLEDFISFLIPQNDKLLAIADSTLNEIEEQKLNKYSDAHKSKARIHTWLAWQETPGMPLGLSITKKYLSTEGETCQRFIKWLKDLFG
ncbi:MAG: hypothetical protein LBJ67_08665 [Planctomycetaceae bacterium]|jgi:hypothetical protein|nr:hypothetical protein [Planctomycetaceae bacterium]